MVGTNRSMAAMSGAWLRKKVRHPWLGACPFDHVLGDARLRDFKPELEQFAVDAWRAQADFQTLIRRINMRSSVSICGRPPCGRDFQRQ